MKISSIFAALCKISTTAVVSYGERFLAWLHDLLVHSDIASMD